MTLRYSNKGKFVRVRINGQITGLIVLYQLNIIINLNKSRSGVNESALILIF